MKRLGYTQFVASGGDWGDSGDGEDGRACTIGRARHPPEHAFRRAGRNRESTPVRRARRRRASPPTRGSAYDQLDFFLKYGLGYANEMRLRPQTLYAIEDSPIGLAAWILDHDIRSYELIARVFDGQAEGLTRDDILDNITLYWLTNTAVSSARLYWENKLVLFAPLACDHPGCRERLSRRALPGPAHLGGKNVPQADPLQPTCQGRPLRGVGAARAVHLRTQSGVPVATLNGAFKCP